MIVEIDEIKSIRKYTMHVDTEMIRVFLKNGKDIYVSPLLAKRAIMNGFGLTIRKDVNYILPYETLKYVLEY